MLPILEWNGTPSQGAAHRPRSRRWTQRRRWSRCGTVAAGTVAVAVPAVGWDQVCGVVVQCGVVVWCGVVRCGAVVRCGGGGEGEGGDDGHSDSRSGGSGNSGGHGGDGRSRLLWWWRGVVQCGVVRAVWCDVVWSCGVVVAARVRAAAKATAAAAAVYLGNPPPPAVSWRNETRKVDRLDSGAHANR